MSDYLLGIDIGTSACKLAVMDSRGKQICAVSEKYPVYYPQAGWAEQDPEDWWRAVYGGLQRIFHENAVKAAEIAAIGIDGQSWSAIALDQAGRVLSRTPIWTDTRSEALCAEASQRIGAEVLFACCGNPLKPQYTTGKILWYQKYLPQMYTKIDKIVQSNSFIAYRLTGQIVQDLSQGYGLHCFDMRRGCWNEEICAELGVAPALLPEIVPCDRVIGKVSREAAALSGLKAGTPVVAGGLDAACGTLGAGVIRAGQTQEQGGQAGGMSICQDQYHAEKNLILSFHVVTGEWLLQGGTTGGGGALNWFEQQFGFEERQAAKICGGSAFAGLSSLASQSRAGSNGIIFLPYMAGERSPIWDAKARGVFYGINFATTKADMTRAVMEGVAYALRHNLETAESSGARVDSLRAMGGSANSDVWMQIKADVTGKAICVPSSDAATTLGASILAGIGVGIYAGYEEAVRLTVSEKKQYLPNEANQTVYDAGYRKYRALYDSLRPLMNEE